MNQTVRKVKVPEILRQKIKAYQHLFEGPDAKIVMDDLYQKFNGTTLKSKDGIIDVNASMAASGCREVLLYIEQMMRINDALD